MKPIILTINLVNIFLFVQSLPKFETNTTEHDSFELQCDLMVGDKIPVKKYRSLKTGLTVVVANVEGPLVSGYLVLGTEARSDDGLPHTLEHLVFLGSEKYPYKGVLDIIANRCLASGTNAWTAVDHTAYTIQTAGSEGFLNFLPIYMDHLLFPTLTESGYTTEIYHITEKGSDAGVAFSEILSRENGRADRAWSEYYREMYPFPSGYRFRTGGALQNFRNSTNLDKIKKYHRAFYRPDNLNVVVIGQIKPEEVFKALEEVEETIIAKGIDPPTHKPWNAPVPCLTKSIDKQVLFNSDKEEQGTVMVGWRGPSPIENPQEFHALAILVSYLTYSSVSILQNIFVEVDDALSLGVSGWLDHYLESNVGFGFSGVDLNNMMKIKPKLYQTLHQLSTGALTLDMEDIDIFLENLSIRKSSGLEGNPQGAISGIVIQEQLYGKSCDDLDKGLNTDEMYSYLRRQKRTFWLNLLRKYMISSPSVTIRATPSISRSEKIQKETKAREEHRKELLGEEGLQELKEKLEKANERNKIPPPPEMISSVPIAKVNDMHYHYVRSYTNINKKYVPEGVMTTSPSFFKFEDMPVKMILTDIHSNFVEIMALLDASKLPKNLRQYLPLFLDLLLESSIEKNGEILDHEDVIRQRVSDLLSAGASLSLGNYNTFLCGGFCHVVRVRMEVDRNRYEKGVEWMMDILFNVIFDRHQIKTKATNLLKSIKGYKSSAYVISNVIYNDITFINDTTRNQINPFRMESFLEDVLDKLEDSPEEVIDDLNQVLIELTKLDNIIIAIGTDFKKLNSTMDISKPWKSFTPNNQKATNYDLTAISSLKEKSNEKLVNSTGYIYGLKSTESSYLNRMVPLLTDYNNPDYPALRVALKYLTQSEGPLWRGIRGKGLAYGFQLYGVTSHRNLFFSLTEASQLPKAYEAGISIINGHANGTIPFEQSLFESAKASLIYGVIASESQIYDKYWQSVLSFYNNRTLDENRKTVEDISKVTIEDVKRVSMLYLTPLSNATNGMTIIVCHPSKINETKEALQKQYGHNLHELQDIEDSRFSM